MQMIPKTSLCSHVTTHMTYRGQGTTLTFLPTDSHAKNYKRLIICICFACICCYSIDSSI